MLYFNLGNNLSAALKELERIEGSTRQPELFAPKRPPQITPQPAPPPARPNREQPTSDIVLTEIQPLTNYALISYLNSRGISAAPARPCVQEAHYTNRGKPYFALALANRSGGYELRNPYFQNSIAPKDISLPGTDHPGQAGSDLALFEGFFDYLSAIALNLLPHPNTPAMVLNSAAMRERALKVIQERQAQSNDLKRILLFMDDDPTGRELTRYFQHELKDVEVVDKATLYQGQYKDLNKMHETMHQAQQRSQHR